MPLPSLDDLLATLRVVRLPLNTKFRGVTYREVAIIDGPCGTGEFAPFIEYGPAEASRWLGAAIEAAYAGWPPPVRDRVPVNATVPAVSAAEVPAVIARYDGCRTAKVKVAEAGQSLTDDLARVAAVREVMGRDAKVRVDANGGWSVDDALAALGRLSAFDLEYAEQPCASVEELASLRMSLARNGIDLPVAADESIRKADDPLRVARLGAADIAVVKVAPMGGVRPALTVAQQAGLPVVVSSALDTSVGMAAGVALAAALPRLEHACGLGTIELFEGDVVTDSLVPQGGSLPVIRPEVDPALVARWAAPTDRADWWRERVRAAYPIWKATVRNGS
ncbi:o-succinylbenzoate synthase [Metallococcus carri]|uniref:o-succinylbenzoate synthase n=1 Tax=Metallococcus carri TaxID=1656884 RepID=UPI002E2C59DB|nr:o-succinylbenzoate synthase [Metallococcus carri]